VVRSGRGGRPGSCSASRPAGHAEAYGGERPISGEGPISSADVTLPRRRDRRGRAHGGVEDRKGDAEQDAATGAQPDLIRPRGQLAPVEAAVEADAVDAGVAPHGEEADDPTEREDLDHGKPYAPRVAKAESEDRGPSPFRAVQDEESLGTANVCNCHRGRTRTARRRRE